jgi:hypothetical protein
MRTLFMDVGRQSGGTVGKQSGTNREGQPLLVLAVFLYGTLVLPERPSGQVIILLIGLLAAAMPVLHLRGAHYGEIAKSPGGFFFVWILRGGDSCPLSVQQ